MNDELNLADINVVREKKIIFMGTPEFSVPVLAGLLDNYKIRAVVTQPDRPIGREQRSVYSPVKELALKHTLLVLQPEKIKTAVEEIKALEPDLIITCAYGQILPPELLEIPKLGCINVHASLLPKLRGGAPIHRAIMEGYKKTGITIMYMSKDMDTGDIISQAEIDIEDTDTASILHDKLSILGRDTLLKTLPSILTGTNSRTKQNSSEATYAFNIKREDEKIDFSKTKREVYNHIRGLNAWPGAYCLFEGKILKVWNCYTTDNYFPNLFDGQITNIYKDGFGVKVSNGEVIFTVVQPEGKKKMTALDFVNGYKGVDPLIGKVLD